MREKLKFEPNVPVTVTLQYSEGKIVDGRFGEQVMFSLEGNQVMYLDLAVAQKINMLEPAVGESFAICKRWNGQKGQAVRWDVWLSPETEKMRAAKENPEPSWTTPRTPARSFDPGNMYQRPAPPSELEQQLQSSLDEISRRNRGANLVERRPPAAAAMPPAAAPQGTGTNGPVAVPRAEAMPTTTTAAPAWAGVLIAKATALVDVYAACLEDAATKHGNHVKPDDVRALVTTVYIAMTKNGVSHAA